MYVRGFGKQCSEEEKKEMKKEKKDDERVEGERRRGHMALTTWHAEREKRTGGWGVMRDGEKGEGVSE